MKHFTLTIMMAFATSLGLQAQTVIYSQDFSSAGLPVGWTNVDRTGNNATNGIWKRFTSSQFQSETYSNGYWIFLSDAQNDDNLPEDGELTSGRINCSANAKVFLRFQHWFYTYFENNTNSVGYVQISTNNTTWTEVWSTTESSDNPAVVNVDLSAYAANQDSLYVRFKFTGDWDGYWAVDDIKITEPAALDVAIKSLNVEEYVAPSNQTISGVLENLGSDPISQVTLSYTINGGAPVTQNLSNLAIQPFDTYNFSFNTPANLSAVQSYTIVANATSPNGGTDLNPSNNAKSAMAYVLSQFPKRNVLLEEFTTAPCQYCPDAATRMNAILARNQNLIGVAIHSGFGSDAMTIDEHDTLANEYTDGAPAIMIDRVYQADDKSVAIGYYNDPYDKWEPYSIERKAEITPVSIAANNTYDGGTRQLTVNVSATFYSAISDDFRVNCYIVEDSVSGTGSGYNQSNASNNDNTSEWYQKGNPIVGYQHRHVVRHMFGATWGSTGVVPATTADGVAYNKQYTYTLPNGWDESQVEVVAIVQRYDANNKYNRQILNALELKLNTADSTGLNANPNTAIENTNSAALATASVYPNPATDVIHVAYALNSNASFSMEVNNMIGQTMVSYPVVNLQEGNYNTAINTASYANGFYFVQLKENGKTVKTMKFVVNK
ncbi:MAG TPA: Omp28-related outer membrane protein [Chitinophagales bacterium]|nr:Omp28-related outer membrane protein [Chitinophagales bacterium]